MIVRQFLSWVRTAPAGERAEATRALARAYLISNLTDDDRLAAEGALLMHIANTLAAIRSEVTRHLGESALPEMSALTKVFSLVALAGQREAPAATEADATQETAAEQPPAAS